MTNKLRLSPATPAHRNDIDRIRHDVYAAELGQFTHSPDGLLRDRPEVESVYITAVHDGKLVGFVGITPPASPRYSVDHYLSRGNVPVQFDQHLYEIRALTVIDPARGSLAAPALMYAAFRWVQSRGGQQLMAIGHQKVVDMYLRAGMQKAGRPFQCGNLEYELLTASIRAINEKLTRFNARLNRLEKQVEWQLDSPFHRPADCYHGGAFFNAIGNQFDDLNRRNEIINADVLDAWFPPCPSARQALQEHLDWIMRTSPPNHAEGLAQTIAEVRGVDAHCILTGGGSSPLIFLAFRQWLKPTSRVLLLDPTYGEYAHVLEKVVGCNVERLKLDRDNEYRLDMEELTRKLAEEYDLFVWVNPNSPTGQHISRAEAEALLSRCPPTTRVWIDETYVEYAGREQSLESFASQSANTVVCKSMSKVYSLSGLRVGYLCGPPGILEPLRALTPPWSVGLAAQVAAVHALNSPGYYEKLYKETHRLRAQLVEGLQQIGIREIIPGIANFILFHLEDHHPDAATVIHRCREKGLFLRDASEMGSGLGNRAIRIAVKDAQANHRMLQILGTALSSETSQTP
ncbi:MAG: aminotransferase class I/II-fold pyridoxal phosphate-dependent enzyme [Kiritimatiellales bacterium]|nr:aminotransferase class I/II-fold pyridoxal phosphate-dependent enzyme [Kiritimatiellales bacterium]